MNNQSLQILSLCILILGCKTAPKELEETEISNPKTSVEITTIRIGSIEDDLALSATSIYQKRNLVTATIPAFITKVNIKLGDAVLKGDVLYELESKERRSLGNSAANLDSTLANFGLLKVRASASGVISTLDKQQPGDYVLEGTLLCTIAESSDLTFQVNVPYEFSPFAKPGKVCRITLPDNSIHNGHFTKALTSMNVLAQTQVILAKSDDALFLPENMIVKVTVDKGNGMKQQIVPKACVLGDEMMRSFWVMKLINDTTAIKVTVITGNKSDENTEIISPKFNPEDRLIVVGNYGLPDTALVNVIKTDKK